MSPSLRLLALGALLCTACGAPIPPFAGRNNFAEVSGESVGSGAAAAGVLRKQLQVSASGLTSSFKVGDVWAMRNTASSKSVYLAISITNTDARPACFVKLTDILWKDGSGATLKGPDLTFVQGSVGIIGSGETYTDTCLAAGEQSYAFQIAAGSSSTPDWYGSIASISFAIARDERLPTEPTAKLRASKYQKASASSVRVTFENQGSGSASVGTGSFSRFVLLDASGAPVTWSFLTHAADATVAAGSTTTADGTLTFEGSATRLGAYADFKQAAGSKQLRALGPGPLSDAEAEVLAREWVRSQPRE